MEKPRAIIRRILRQVFCAVFLLSLPIFPLPARAAESAPVFHAALNKEELRRGASFSVTLTPAQDGLSAFVLFAQYDPDDITKAAAVCSDSKAYLYTSDQDGRLAVVYTAKDGGYFPEDGTLTLTFRTSTSALSDSVPVQITVTDAASADADMLLSEPEQHDLEPIFEPEPASDSALVSLTPPAGKLVPEFDPAIFDYTLEVPFSSVSLVFDAEPAEGASVRVNRKNLGAGGSTVDFSFTVTAGDGVSKSIYTVAVTRHEKESTPTAESSGSIAGGTPGSHGSTSKNNTSTDKSSSGESDTSEPVENTKPGGTVSTVDTVYVSSGGAPYDTRADRFETMAIVLISVGAGMGFAVFVLRFGKRKDDEQDR